MFIDLHCHLLPGVDDGARHVRESIDLARTLVSCGFGSVVATPHIPTDTEEHRRAGEKGDAKEGERCRRLGIGRTTEAIASHVRELECHLQRAEIPLNIAQGAENQWDKDFFDRELTGEGAHLNGTKYVLVELPCQAIVPNLMEMIFALRRVGTVPVIAHPERYIHFQKSEKAADVLRVGALLQLDLLSVKGYYGREVRKAALRFLEKGWYAVAATDLHRMEDGIERNLRLCIEEIGKRFGPPAIERLLRNHPVSILQGADIPAL